MICFILKDNVMSRIIDISRSSFAVQIKLLCTLLGTFIGISAIHMFLRENGIPKHPQSFILIARKMKS